MARDKVRIRFRKAGDLRLLSHHDLMRSCERALRRAALPFRSTEGFHPTPRLVFALALPLGVSGLHEVVELELNEEIASEDVLDRLRRHAPPGLVFLSACRIPANATGRPFKALYRLPVPPAEAATLPERCAAFLAAGDCWVERQRPTPRRVDVRPFVDGLTFVDAILHLAMWVSPSGSARADEIVRAIGLGSLLDSGAVLERTDLLLADEADPAEAARAPERLVTAGLPATGSVPAPEPEGAPALAAHWGASPNGPVVE